MSKQRLLLGFSGGIDSRAAVGRLQAEGYEVVALTIDTIGDEQMLHQAREAAETLGIEWLSYDAREEFKREIIDYFISEYLMGRTPAPCTRCNTHIKWRVLTEVADSLHIEHIATGHYFNVVQQDSHYYVAKGADTDKDQSYYLWGLPQQTLQRIVTPMGNAIKSVIKADIADKRESMGICFLKGCSYGEFLRHHTSSINAGDIVNRDGKMVGRHDGIALYTIGQKRGTGIPEGMCVTNIDSTANRLIVGKNDDLYKSKLYINECVIVNEEELLTANNITIKIRGIGRNPSLPVSIQKHKNGYLITSPEKVWAPAQGQPLVFYRNNLVLGGGIVVDFE